LERPNVTQRIHRLPEAAMAISDKLAVAGETFEGAALEDDLVAADPVQDGRFEHEEPGVDPGAVSGRLFLEGPHTRRHDTADDLVGLDLQGAEAPRRLDGRDRGQLPMSAMEVSVSAPVSTSVTRQGSAAC
jgi:hypothetical protein